MNYRCVPFGAVRQAPLATSGLGPLRHLLRLHKAVGVGGEPDIDEDL